MRKTSLIAPAVRRNASRVTPRLTGPRFLVLAACVPAAGAIALGWPSLVATGIAPLLVSAAPCLAMCALGLCVQRSCARRSTAHDKQ